MGTPSEMNEVYFATLREDWKSLAEFYEKHKDRLLTPMRVSKDTAFHMAVYSEDEKLLKDLLASAQYLPTSLVHEHPINITNVYGNTPLHLATSRGNYEAVRLLVEESQKVLVGESENEKKDTMLMENKFGETPLFRAAAFGRTKIVKYLTDQPAQIVNDELLLVHRQRNDGQSILHVAVLGENFETAVLLLELDKSLSKLTDSRGKTCLGLLAEIPSAFKSGHSMSIFSRYLYMCLPVEDECDEAINEDTSRVWEAMESGRRRKRNSRFSYHVHGVLEWINGSICRLSFKGWPMVERIWENKRKHKFALQLAKMLIRSDVSWDQDITVQGLYGARIGSPVSGPATRGRKVEDKEVDLWHPLLTATKTGILEVVYEMLREYPQSVDLRNKKGQNVLHVAVMYRRKDIFKFMKSNRIISNRMSFGIDKDGYTLLHQVADNTYYSVGSKHGPALQLHEELKWFTRVEKVIPSYYAKLRDFKHKMTAEELFNKMHKKQLLAAQQWVKETAQSCSAVAVLVATIVFAAAYTVPGGSNDKGIPIFLHKNFFLFFTIMDVIALASSLTSVVMFLSILTSPFDYKDFRNSIPRKLTLGFTLLFFSVMATMLAFAATILLIVQSEKQVTAGLISIAAFFPVSVFALMQFRLYAAFMHSTKGIRKAMSRSLPWFGAPLLFRKRKQRRDLFQKK